MELYRGLVKLQINIPWAEQQHTNFILNLLSAASETEEERKPKALSNEVLLKYMV